MIPEITAETVMLVAATVALVFLSGVIGYLLKKRLTESENIRLGATHAELKKRAEADAEQIVKDARLEAKEIIYKGKSAAERDAREKRKELSHIERKLEIKDETLDKKLTGLSKKEEQLDKREEEYQAKLREAENLRLENEEIKGSLLSVV